MPNSGALITSIFTGFMLGTIATRWRSLSIRRIEEVMRAMDDMVKQGKICRIVRVRRMVLIAKVASKRWGN